MRRKAGEEDVEEENSAEEAEMDLVAKEFEDMEEKIFDV